MSTRRMTSHNSTDHPASGGARHGLGYPDAERGSPTIPTFVRGLLDAAGPTNRHSLYSTLPAERRPARRPRMASATPRRHAPTHHLATHNRVRYASMPENRFPREVDTESYRLAKACGQDALSASTSSSIVWGFGLSSEPTRSGHQPFSDPRPTPQSHIFRSPPRPPPPPFPHPRAADVLQSLTAELRKQGLQLQDYVNPDELYEEITEKRENPPSSERGRIHGEQIYIFGSAVTDLDTSAMCTIVHGKYQYGLPVVVVSCVEQLYRTGIYQHQLFRALPDRGQLQRLVDRFNHPAGVSDLNPTCASALSEETMPNICALLHEYISALPSPLIPRNLFDALWAWCILPTCQHEAGIARSSTLTSSHFIPRYHPQAERREPEPHRHYDPHQRRPRGSSQSRVDARRRIQSEATPRRLSLPARHPLASTRSHDERPQLALAHYIFLLLPPRCFALLSYLFSFFSQLPLSPANGITYEDISRIFAPALLGGPRNPQQQHEEDVGNRSEGAARMMMVWLLGHWSTLLDIFENTTVPTGGEEVSTSGSTSLTNDRPQVFLTNEGIDTETDPDRYSRSQGEVRGGHVACGPTAPDEDRGSGPRQAPFSNPFPYTHPPTESTELSGDATSLRQQLEVAVSERDHARSIVREITHIVERYM